jgi:biotin carboxyl carrier protein
LVPEAATLEEFAPAPEVTHIDEKVIVAPCAGRFYPLPPEVFTTEGEWVDAGQPVGEVLVNDERRVVTSPHRGWMMGMLAVSGQPVRSGEALFWVRGR